MFTIAYNFRQYRPQKGGICVANHTSPIDVLILTTDGCYAMVRAADWSFSSCVVEIAQMVYFGTNGKVSSHWLFWLYCCSCYRIYLHQEYIGWERSHCIQTSKKFIYWNIDTFELDRTVPSWCHFSSKYFTLGKFSLEWYKSPGFLFLQELTYHQNTSGFFNEALARKQIFMLTFSVSIPT